jgi:hypothetical protein
MNLLQGSKELPYSEQSSPPRKHGTDSSGGGGGDETANKHIISLAGDYIFNMFSQDSERFGHFDLNCELPLPGLKALFAHVGRGHTLWLRIACQRFLHAQHDFVAYY